MNSFLRKRGLMASTYYKNSQKRNSSKRKLLPHVNFFLKSARIRDMLSASTTRRGSRRKPISVWTNEQRVVIWYITMRCSFLPGTQENAPKTHYVNPKKQALPCERKYITTSSVCTMRMSQNIGRSVPKKQMHFCGLCRNVCRREKPNSKKTPDVSILRLQ